MAAHELWLVPSWASRSDVQAAQEDTIQMIYDVTRKSYRVPPYTPDERDAAIAEATARRDEELTQLRDKFSAAETEDEHRRRRALAGSLVLVAIGSLLQAVAILIAK